MFDTLLSNNRMKTELTRAITLGRHMHAYLFCGADGSGKMTAAKLLARELVGANKDKADRGSHPDIFILAPEKDKKTITVDQVRNMRSDTFVNPSEGTKKVYIVDGMELMNESGQNALLTILEQPPSFAVFILLSESREKVLPTVVSRCAVFEMEYVDAKEGADFLRKLYPDIDQEQLITSMTASEGNVGLAQKFLSNEQFDKNIQTAFTVAEYMADKKEYELAKILTAISKDEICDFLSILCMVLRDILVLKTASDENLVFKQKILQNKSKFAKINSNVLYNGIYECEKAIELVRANISLLLIAPVLVIQLIGGKQID